MTRVQTRRSVSISGDTYKRLKKYAQRNEKSMSGTVEKLLKDFLSRQERPDEPPNKVQSTHFSF